MREVYNYLNSAGDNIITAILFLAFCVFFALYCIILSDKNSVLHKGDWIMGVVILIIVAIIAMVGF